jgi:hypothetical protein
MKLIFILRNSNVNAFNACENLQINYKMTIRSPKG